MTHQLMRDIQKEIFALFHWETANDCAPSLSADIGLAPIYAKLFKLEQRMTKRLSGTQVQNAEHIELSNL